MSFSGRTMPLRSRTGRARAGAATRTGTVEGWAPTRASSRWTGGNRPLSREPRSSTSLRMWAGSKKCESEFSLFQVTTTTKTIREVQYIGPDGLPIDFIPGQEGNGYNGHGGHMDYQNQQFADYQLYQQQQQQQYPHDYNRPPTPPTPSERSNSPLNNHRGKKLESNRKQARSHITEQGGAGWIIYYNYADISPAAQDRCETACLTSWL